MKTSRVFTLGRGTRLLLAALIMCGGSFQLRADDPVEVLPGECALCDVFPASTNAAGQVHRMTMYTTSGGSLPRGFQVPTKADGVQVESGAYLADLITVQHTYAASFDIDLAPKVVVDANNLVPYFESDTFDAPTFLGGLNRLIDIPGNKSDGFWVEDYNYSVSPGEWPVGAAMGYDCLDRFYHAPGEGPGQREYDYDLNCSTSPTPEQIAAFRATARYQMTCNVGPNLLTGIADPSNVAVAGEPLPPAVPEKMVVASNGAGIQLITGPLALYWAIRNPPSLSIERLADALQITFTDGVLQYTDSIMPEIWTDIGSSSPLKVLTAGPQRYYRVRQ